MIVALDATPLTLSSGGLPRYVNELSVALAREFPEDTYSLLSDQPFPMPGDAPANLVRGRAPDTAAERRWWFWGIRRAIHQSGAQVFHGTNFEVPYLGDTPAILTIHDLSPWRDRAWHTGADRVRRRTPRSHQRLSFGDCFGATRFGGELAGNSNSRSDRRAYVSFGYWRARASESSATYRASPPEVSVSGVASRAAITASSLWSTPYLCWSSQS